jgi:hypothetical protein
MLSPMSFAKSVMFCTSGRLRRPDATRTNPAGSGGYQKLVAGGREPWRAQEAQQRRSPIVGTPNASELSRKRETRTQTHPIILLTT